MRKPSTNGPLDLMLCARRPVVYGPWDTASRAMNCISRTALRMSRMVSSMLSLRARTWWMMILAIAAIQVRDLGHQIHVSLGAVAGSRSLHLPFDHKIEACECVRGSEVLPKTAHCCVDGLH